jgi:hypothetical protein
MLRNKTKEQNESGFSPGLFPSKNPSHFKVLKAIISAGIAQKDDENAPLTQTFIDMIEWLKGYVNNPNFLSSYTQMRSLELVAEATYWTVKLGLEPHLAKMYYMEFMNFKPLEESFREKTERSKLFK